MSESKRRTPQSGQSDRLRRFQIAFEFSQALERAEREAYAHYDQLEGEETQRVGQAVAVRDRVEEQSVQELTKKHGISPAELIDILEEQSDIYAIELAGRYPIEEPPPERPEA